MTDLTKYALGVILQRLQDNPGELITLHDGTTYKMCVERGMFVHLYADGGLKSHDGGGVGVDENGGPKIACTPFYNDDDHIDFDEFAPDYADSVHMGRVPFVVKPHNDVFADYKFAVTEFLQLHTGEWRQVERIEVECNTDDGNSTWIWANFQESVANDKYTRAKVTGSIYGGEWVIMSVNEANKLLADYAKH